MKELTQILNKLKNIEQNQDKNWLAQLTEQSGVLLTTHDIANLTGLSYDYTYKKIVSQPDFPRPITVGEAKDKQNRRWVSGKVIAHLKSINRI